MVLTETLLMTRAVPMPPMIVPRRPGFYQLPKSLLLLYYLRFSLRRWFVRICKDSYLSLWCVHHKQMETALWFTDQPKIWAVSLSFIYDTLPANGLK
jgi:hypothetical protein